MTTIGWLSIVRLGLVQASIGAMVMLSTSVLNRVMVVEYALPAALPAGLIAWHYAVQLSRPVWGHSSDRGGRRAPWIVGGLGILALGTLIATNAAFMTSDDPVRGIAIAVLAYSMIGGGVGAAGTSLLALLATHVAPERRAAAAATTWIMMIAGIVVTAGVAGSLLDPFSPSRLATVVGGVVLVAFAIGGTALWGLEHRGLNARVPDSGRTDVAFKEALLSMWADREARRFTYFVFVAMLAYAMQDVILEPFAGLRFGMTPGESTQLSGAQHAGVLAGMIIAGLGGGRLPNRSGVSLRLWIVGGCLASASALLGLAMASAIGPGWPLVANAVLLGLANGIFSVAAIGAMMELAGAGRGKEREGTRMGVWGAAQAIAFGLGGLTGAVASDVLRALTDDVATTFIVVFGFEAVLFIAAALLAMRLIAVPNTSRPQPA